jgi:NifU-like protein involved in Fe-S cluster formation
MKSSVMVAWLVAKTKQEAKENLERMMAELDECGDDEENIEITVTIEREIQL